MSQNNHNYPSIGLPKRKYWSCRGCGKTKVFCTHCDRGQSVRLFEGDGVWNCYNCGSTKVCCEHCKHIQTVEPPPTTIMGFSGNTIRGDTTTFGHITHMSMFIGNDIVGIIRDSYNADNIVVVSYSGPDAKIRAQFGWAPGVKIVGLVASSSADKIAGSSDNGIVFLSDLKTGKKGHRFFRPKSSLSVDVIAFSPCGTKLAYLIDDKSLYVIDVNTGSFINEEDQYPPKQLYSIDDVGSYLYSIDFTKNGDIVVINAECRIVCNDDGKKKCYPHAELFGSFDIAALMSPDGTKIVGASTTDVFVIDTLSNERKSVWKSNTLFDKSVASFVIQCSREISNTSNSSVVRNFTAQWHGHEIHGIALSPDEKRAAIILKINSAGDTHLSVIVFDAKTWIPQLKLYVAGTCITELEFSPDSNKLMTLSGAPSYPNSHLNAPMIWTLPPDDFCSFGFEARDLKLFPQYKEKLTSDKDAAVKVVLEVFAARKVPDSLARYMLSFLM